MALSKVTYVDGVTIIGAKNLNDIQDELIRQGEQQAEDEAELALKANTADVQTALALKADKSDTYTKAEVNEALGLKANTADVNEALALKADKTETYTKTQVDSMIQEAVEEAVKESEYSNFEMKSVSGDFIHITDGAGLIPVKDLKIGIDAVQDLHGYDAPWVGGAGKNKYNAPDGSVNTSGMVGTQVSLEAGTYTFSADAYRQDAGSATFRISSTGGVLAETESVIGATTYKKLTASFTLSETTTVWVGASFYTSYSTLYYKNVMIESGSSATDFAPYTNICPISGWTGANIYVSPTADEEDATVYNVSWEDEAGTVYGGTLDVTTGELSVNSFYYEAQGTEEFALSGSGQSYINVNNRYPYCNGTSANDGICSHFGFGSGKVFAGISPASGKYLAFAKAMVDSALSISTAEAFNTWLATQKANGTPVVVCYKLAEPISFTIDPTEVLTLLGENNIFADTGAVEELIYRISRQ